MTAFFIRVFLGSGLLLTSKMIFSRFFKKQEIEKFNPDLTRDDLIHRCRILVIDDDRPKLMDDLMRSGFYVDYDATGNDLSKVEMGLYDLILLDFGGVGGMFGKDEGLSVLKHIKRINPSQFVLAYTSKSLPPNQSEFYRLTDGTLYKDAGIQESFAKIEESLKSSLNVDRLWKAALAAIPNNQTRNAMEKAMEKALKRKTGEPLFETLAATGGKLKDKALEKSVEKIVDLMFKGGAG